MLRKFNFPGFQQSQSIHRNRRYLNAKLATLTPLGISQPLRPKDDLKRDKVTPFEEIVKKGTSPMKHPAEYQFDDGYREDEMKIKKEESVCGEDEGPFWASFPSPSRPGSYSPTKTSSQGNEKENQRPENAYKSADAGQCDLHRTPLENKILTSPSRISKTTPSIIDQLSEPTLSLVDQTPTPNFSGPEFTLLGERAISTTSLPSTATPPSPSSAEDTKTRPEQYRKPRCESDADDEASDKETRPGSDEEVLDDYDEQARFEDAETDEALQSAMHKIQLGKRSRDGDDDDGREDVVGAELRLPLGTPKELLFEMGDQREEERERVIAGDLEGQIESAGPAKRRKGEEGELVSLKSSSLDGQIDDGEMVSGEMEGAIED